MRTAKYGVTYTLYFPIVKRGAVDLAGSADWTPAAGDVKISKDGGNVANTTNLPTAVGGTGSVLWALVLTTTEMQAARVRVQIVDAATKAVEDAVFEIDTFGNASAAQVPDWSDGVRVGLTALPNAAAGANGGLPTVDSTGAVKVQARLKKNATGGLRVPFQMTDSTNHNPIAGKTVTATRALDGGSFTAIAGTVAEQANGWYYADLTQADINGNEVQLEFNASGCDMTPLVLFMEP